MFIDSGIVTSSWGKEPPGITNKEELKKEAAREELGELIAHGWSRTVKVLAKKRSDTAPNFEQRANFLTFNLKKQLATFVFRN